MPELQCNVYFFNPQSNRPDPQATRQRNRPLLIFLPGLNETDESLMLKQTASLEACFDVRCLVIPPKDLDDWDLLAESTLALIERELAQNGNRPVYLCGESFGGCLALEMLIQAPDWFEKIILINPASSFPQVFWLSFGSQFFPLVPDWIYNNSAFLSLPFLAHIDKISAQACQDLANTITLSDKQTAQKRIAMMREFTIDEHKLRQVSQPVLLIGSREDLILPSVDEAQRLAKIFPKATVVTLPHSGHACLVEKDIDLYQIMQVNDFTQMQLV